MSIRGIGQMAIPSWKFSLDFDTVEHGSLLQLRWNVSIQCSHESSVSVGLSIECFIFAVMKRKI